YSARLRIDTTQSVKIRPEQNTKNTLLTMRNHINPAYEDLIRKHWGSTTQEDRMDEKLRSAVQLGEQHYRSKCSYCHLANGQGMKKSLVDSKWVQGTDHALIRIVLHGKEGEGELMQGFAAEVDDAQIASVF